MALIHNAAAMSGLFSSRSVCLSADPDEPTEPPSAANHFSPYSYDTHVPLIIMGNKLKPGRYVESASPADIATTLANILGIQAPSNATGRVLKEAIKR